MRIIEPRTTDDLLRNPGIGFIAAPGLEDPGNPALHEALYRFTPDSPVYNHPDSGVTFVSARWAKVEAIEGEYDWSPILRQVEEAAGRGRLSVLRCAPYALGDDDIPSWLRRRNPERPDFPFWQIDPNTTDYAACWARFVREMAKRLDGHPHLASVDMALVGAWGEGGGTEFMRMDKLAPIIEAYLDGFATTPLQCLLHDPHSLAVIRAGRRRVGFRVDCLGDLGGFHGKRWSHMLDFYPQNIENFGMGQAWERAPVLFEACWTMKDWYRNGWDIRYIIEESLKWHITSFNSKGCPVPAAWRDEVAQWVRKMGYRFELRRVILPDAVRPGGSLRFRSLWRNSGVAPCYHPFRVQYHLRDENGRELCLNAGQDVRTWLPGEDQLLDEEFALTGLAAGNYRVAVGITSGIDGFPALMLGTRSQPDHSVDAGVLRVAEEG